MSKKQQTKTQDSVTITSVELDCIKSALRRINWMHEDALMSPAPSDGYMWVMVDMANYIAEVLKVKDEVQV